MTRGEDVGSAADEAVRLLAVAESWARRHASTFVDDEHLATGSPECTVCPVCQAVGALRRVRPETVAHLLDAGAALSAALRSAVAAEAGSATPPPASRVQRIDIDGDVAGDPGVDGSSGGTGSGAAGAGER